MCIENQVKYPDVFNYENFLEALGKCNKGVMHKGSVQLYNMYALERIEKSMRFLNKFTLPPVGRINQVAIRERGKSRVITPIKISDRMVQRVLCDYALTPTLMPTLIYDNGASIKGRGVSFTRKRLQKKILQANREFCCDYYVLVFDFKNFFNSIPHKACKFVIDKKFKDKRIVNITMDVIKSYQIRLAESAKDFDEVERIKRDEGVGICLGSQVSQIMALCVPNVLDHFVKDVMREKYYLRYMDDGVVFSKSKEHLKELLKKMKDVVSTIGLKFNENKTRICKISKGFKFMKVKYSVIGGKTIKRLDNAGTTRMRRKLKKFVHLVKEGKMTMDDVYTSMQSWLGHTKIARSFKIRRNIMRLYNKLFGGYRITKGWWKRHPKFNQRKVTPEAA